MNEQSDNGLQRQLYQTGQPPMTTGSHSVAVYNPYTLSKSQHDDLDVRRVWQIMKRYRWLILSVVAVFVITTLILTLTMRPVYRATALVELKPHSPVLSIEGGQGNSRNAREFRNTQTNILKSEAVTQRVIRRHELHRNPEFTGEMKQRGLPAVVRAVKKGVNTAVTATTDALSPALTQALDSFTKNERQHQTVAASSSSTQPSRTTVQKEPRKDRALMDRYMSRLDVQQIQDSDLLRVSFESFDAHTAAQLANAHTREYIRFIDERRFNSTSSARDYLQEQIEIAEKSLEQSEKTLHAFAREHNIVDVEDRGNVMQSRFEDVSRALTDTRQKRIIAEVEFRQAGEGNGESLPAVLTSDIIRELRKRYADLRAEYQQKSQRYKDNFPIMQQMKSRLDDIKATLEEERVKLVMGLKLRYEQLRDQEVALQEQLDEQRTELLDLKERAISYNILKREWEANRELYSGLLERQKDFRVASGMEFNDASIVDAAMVPTSKHKPDNLKNASMAGVFGLIGGMGIAFLLAFLDNTFKCREELEQTLNIPFMGVVPKLKADKEGRAKPTALIAAYQPSSAIAEAVRSIRTGVLFSRPEHVPKKILVTSATSGEGKSTVALNFALILAQGGSRVVIIDADLRKPVISRCLDIEPGIGLSDYLDGMEIDIVTTTSFENLFAVSAGGETARPTDLLASLRMRDYLDTLAKRFDFVIIDGPPCLGVADSMLLSAKVDGSLLVVKAGSTEKHVVAETVNRLRMVNAPIIGSVLNLVDLNMPEFNYYGRYYGYGGQGRNGRPGSKEMERSIRSPGMR